MLLYDVSINKWENILEQEESKSMKKIFIGVMIVISFVFVVKISCVQTQNIMGNETSQEENCEQLSWTLKNGILIISGQGKIPTDFLKII